MIVQRCDVIVERCDGIVSFFPNFFFLLVGTFFVLVGTVLLSRARVFFSRGVLAGVVFLFFGRPVLFFFFWVPENLTFCHKGAFKSLSLKLIGNRNKL